MMIVISSSLARIRLEQRKPNIPTSRNLRPKHRGCRVSLGNGSLPGYFIPPLSSCLSPQIADPVWKVSRTALTRPMTLAYAWPNEYGRSVKSLMLQQHAIGK